MVEADTHLRPDVWRARLHVAAERLATLPPCILASAGCVRSRGAAATASSLSMAFRHHVQSLNFLPRLNRDKFAPHTPFPPRTPVVYPSHPSQPMIRATFRGWAADRPRAQRGRPLRRDQVVGGDVGGCGDG